MGYDGQSPDYLVYFTDKREVRRVRCVRFTNRFEVEIPNFVTYDSDSDNDMTYPSKSQGNQPQRSIQIRQNVGVKLMISTLTKEM